jgi:tetratricopeptide (TPR) repeat protein
MAFTFSCALCVAASATASPHAQKKGSEAAKPSQKPVETGGVKPAATPDAQRDETARERRAQAYAKLLEGQRRYAGARAGAATAESLRLAQQSFRQAAELDPTLSEAHTALAEIAFFFLDDLEQAETEGAAAVRIDPDNFGARRVLSRVFTIKSNFMENDPDTAYAKKAVTELIEVTRLRPSDAEGWALLGEIYQATGRDAEAVEAFRKWAALPASIDARFFQVVTKGRELSPAAANARLAETLLRTGRTKEAADAARRAISLEPENPRYFELLGEALESGDVDESTVKELRRMVAQSPRNAVAVGLLARSEARSGRVDDAVATLRAGIAAASKNEGDQIRLRLQISQTFADAERYEEAVAVYEELLKARRIGDAPLTSDTDKRFAAAALSAIISLWQQAGQLEKAFAGVERMRRLLGDDPAADIQNVNLLRSQGKRAEALEAVRAARQKHPEQLRLLRLEAIALTDLGRIDEALALMRARLKGDPQDYEEYVVIATLLTNAGRGSEAVEAARKALELAPPDEPERLTNALLLLSSAQERAGDLKGSEESLRKILSKEPNNATALNNLGYFLTERNERLPEALEMIRRALRSQPSNPSFLDSLGWVYFKLGKLEEAERYLGSASRRNPASAAIQEHLGDLLQRLGRGRQARAAWQKALNLSTEASDMSRIKTKLNAGTNK